MKFILTPLDDNKNFGREGVSILTLLLSEGVSILTLPLSEGVSILTHPLSEGNFLTPPIFDFF